MAIRQNLCVSFLTVPVQTALLGSLCVYTYTEIWRPINYMNLQFAPADKAVMKDDN